MGKLIQGDKVFERCDLNLFYEVEVQDQITARSDLVFPGYLYATFSEPIDGPAGRKKADFVLVENQYRCWYVGEVERVGHSLYSHVIPQVQTFRDGYYNDRHANAIKAKNPAIDLERLKVLMANEPPIVYVLVDRLASDWPEAIRHEQAKLGIFEIYRRVGLTEFIFRVNGESPASFSTFLSFCTHHTSIPRLMRLETPSALDIPNKTRIEVEFEERVGSWTVIKDQIAVLLMPDGGNMLETGYKYELHVANDKYYLTKLG